MKYFIPKQKCCLNNFVQIPYNIFINQLIYKCEENNIRCVVVEESYTSGTSFVDGEVPCKENYSKNNHGHKEYLHILPHSVMPVLALLVVEKKHQCRNSEEVKKMDSY